MTLSPKHEREAKEALQQSLKAIERLEAEIEMLSYKARAFDTFAGFVAMLSPNRSAAASGNPNAVWILRKLLAEIEVSEKEQAAAKANMATQAAAEAGDGAS